MRIKKFVCLNCAAPKVNPYKSPYIVCDYCGSFTDIDYTFGLDFWKEDAQKTIQYKNKKIELATKMQYAMQKGQKDEYKKLQREFWDYYYKTFPVYLPPSIDTPEEYKVYLDICADSSTYYAFDNSWAQKNAQLQNLQKFLTYRFVDGAHKVEPTSFFKMAEYYIQITKDGFKEFYEKPEYELMNELLPQAVHLKMKLSSFVQIWTPYLTEQDGDRFIKMCGFSTEYVDVKPQGKTGNCEFCKAELFIPDGSYRVYCESCRKKSRVQTIFHCISCGAENPVPEYPYKPIDCEFCGTENRLISALFG